MCKFKSPAMPQAICGNCQYWDQEHGLRLPNPNRLSKPYLPHILHAPCAHPQAAMTDAPHTIALMDADASCVQYHDGFSPSLKALREERDWQETFPGYYERESCYALA